MIRIRRSANNRLNGHAQGEGHIYGEVEDWSYMPLAELLVGPLLFGGDLSHLTIMTMTRCVLVVMFMVVCELLAFVFGS